MLIRLSPRLQVILVERSYFVSLWRKTRNWDATNSLIEQGHTHVTIDQLNQAMYCPDVPSRCNDSHERRESHKWLYAMEDIMRNLFLLISSGRIFRQVIYPKRSMNILIENVASEVTVGWYTNIMLVIIGFLLFVSLVILHELGPFLCSEEKWCCC